MLSSGIIDLAIGLAFIFGVTAALASVITEMIARFLGLRGAYLLAGLRELLDSSDAPVVLTQAKQDFDTLKGIVAPSAGQPGTVNEAAVKAHKAAAAKDAAQGMSATGALLGSPILRSQGMTGDIRARNLAIGGLSGQAKKDAKVAKKVAKKKVLLPTGSGRLNTLRERRSLPSYISARSFADAVVGMVIPDTSGRTTMTEIQEAIDELPRDSPLESLKTSLKSLATAANGDITRFRDSVEHWYDDHMDRVSGWYKRRTTWITFGVGLILILLLNINAITIGRALYSDSAARTAVSSLAAKSAACPSSQDPKNQDQQNCLERLERQVSDAAQAGLPLGWGIVPACAPPNAGCSLWERYGITPPGDGNWWQVILTLIGFLATIVALAPGAQFWFGLVVKLNSLRSTGPPPATSGTSAQ
jgi:hypothetical protein